jgi:hypothetical protein
VIKGLSTIKVKALREHCWSWTASRDGPWSYGILEHPKLPELQKRGKEKEMTTTVGGVRIRNSLVGVRPHKPGLIIYDSQFGEVTHINPVSGALCGPAR